MKNILAGLFDINLEIEVYNVMTMLYNKSTKYRRRNEYGKYIVVTSQDFIRG